MNTTLLINNKPVCTSTQLYGRKAISIDPYGKTHISDNSICINPSNIKKGDKLLMQASYDSTQHAYDLLMPTNGFDTVMAINNVSIRWYNRIIRLIWTGVYWNLVIESTLLYIFSMYI